MCVTSLLCCPWADLRPFYGLYCKRFSLSLRGAQVSWEGFTVPSIREFELFSLKAICCRNSKQLLWTFAPTIYLKFIWYTYYINKG